MERKLRAQSKTAERRQRRPVRILISSLILSAALALPGCIQSNATDAQPHGSAQAAKRPRKKANAPLKAPPPRLPEYDGNAPLQEIAERLFSQESITCERGKNPTTYKQDSIMRFFDHTSPSLDEPDKLISKLPYPEQAALYRRIMAEADQGQLLGMINYLDSIKVVDYDRRKVRESKARRYLRLENPFMGEHFNTECMARAGIAFRAETLGIMRLIDLSLERGGEGLNELADGMSIFQSMVFYDRLAISLLRWNEDFNPRASSRAIQKLGPEQHEIFMQHLFSFVLADFGMHKTYRSCAWEVRGVSRESKTREAIFNMIREIEKLDAMRD
ncbi:MAG: hypothetical protein ABIH29_02405 [Candidatus Micrarchaeota archaeon]